MKIVLETLGCKLNQAETELLAQKLVAAGHTIVSQVEDADACILNTCTVTRMADAKSRHMLRAARRRNPRILLIATGCYAEREPEELARAGCTSVIVHIADTPSLFRLLGNPDNGSYKMTGENQPFRTRSFIKVQEGCRNFCTYCIVPHVRGEERSVPAGQVIARVKQRVDDGVKEVVITGTKAGSYNDSGLDLAGLLGTVLDETEIERVRLSSLQPQEISGSLIGLWRNERLCPHFHLSIQSGSDTVLRRMNRRYTVSDYRQAVSLIRGIVPDAAITTDIIVGFPGETDDEFAESYSVCRELQFARVHVFPYSPREGTPAARFPGQVAGAIRKKRADLMLALAKESAADFRRRFSGKVMPVLWERQSGGIWSGLTGNYIRVFQKSSANLANRVLPAQV